MHRLLWGKVSQMLFFSFFFWFFFPLFVFMILIIPPQADVQSLMSPGVRHSRCFGSVRTRSERERALFFFFFS